MKKTIALMASLMMGAVMFFGCSANTKETSSDQTQQETQAPAEQEQQPGAENETVNGVTSENTNEVAGETYNIGIMQHADHPALDKAREGFLNALKEKNINFVVDYQNAQGNIQNLTAIASTFANNKVDLIFAIATDSVQVAYNETKEIPILFTAVTDPVDAGLVASLERPGRNVTGTSDMNPIDQQLALIRQIQPEAKVLGVIYNTGEPNSVVQVTRLKKLAPAMGFEIKESVCVDASDVFQSATNLVGKVDGIYLPTDNTIISNLDTITKVCIENKIPLYPSESDALRRGGVASMSVSYYELGRQTGAMAARILTESAKTETMPVEGMKKAALVINLGIAEKMGVTIPQAVLDNADEIIR